MDPAIAPLGAIRGDKWCSGQEDDEEQLEHPHYRPWKRTLLPAS
jgi:hypothetical protein